MVEGGQGTAGVKARGKSELHRAGGRVTPGQRKLEESATESREPVRGIATTPNLYSQAPGCGCDEDGATQVAGDRERVR